MGINANASLFLSSSSLPGLILTMQLPAIGNSSQTAQQLGPAAVLPLPFLASAAPGAPGIVVSDGAYFASAIKYEAPTSLPHYTQGGSPNGFRTKWRLALQLFPSSNASDVASTNASQVVNLWQQPGAEVLDNLYFYDQSTASGEMRGDLSSFQGVVGLFTFGRRVYSSIAFVNGQEYQVPCGRELVSGGHISGHAVHTVHAADLLFAFRCNMPRGQVLYGVCH